MLSDRFTVENETILLIGEKKENLFLRDRPG